jgi:hypothetical protein
VGRRADSFSSDLKRCEEAVRELDCLIFSEAAHASTTALTGRARWRRRLLAATFRNGARSSANEALDVAPALGTLFYRSVAHLLPLLEMAGTLFAQVFVGWHLNLYGYFSQLWSSGVGEWGSAACVMKRNSYERRSAPPNNTQA